MVQKIVVPEGVRFETHLTEGSRGRGLLGVLIVEGQTRQACVVKAVAALGEFSIDGVDCGLEDLASSLTDLRFWSGEPVGDQD
jgi:biotin carboxylase